MVVQLYSSPAGAELVSSERFERKYYVAPREIELAYGLLRQTCLPTGDFASEQINNLYFDTFDLDQHERSASGDYRKDKARIRWYGQEPCREVTQSIFLELKSRQGFTGTKQRLKLTVPAKALALERLSEGIIPRTLLMDTLARFGYFPSEMLQPIIKISYWRDRFIEMMTGQCISLDHHIRSAMIAPGAGNGETHLELPGAVIEIKGKSMELPLTLRQTRMLDTDWTRFSKYSACIDSHMSDPGSIGQLSPSGKII